MFLHHAKKQRRQMTQKRVQPSVAGKTDSIHSNALHMLRSPSGAVQIKYALIGCRIKLHEEKISPRNRSALTQMGEERNILFSTT
jgi:hypothetical protein